MGLSIVKFNVNGSVHKMNLEFLHFFTLNFTKKHNF